MKPFLATALALFGLPLLAQTDATTPATTTPATAPTAPGGGGYGSVMQQALSTLTPAEKDQLNSDRLKAMAQNPDLQTEEMTLMSKVVAMQSSGATPEEEHALGAEMKAHGDKVRAAMIQVDPSVEPVIQKVEAQVAKLRAQLGV